MKTIATVLFLSSAFIANGMTLYVVSNPPPVVSLAWDASLTTTQGVLVYKLYYGPGSRAYTNVVQVGTNLTATVSNLIRGATYYFACTASTTNGLESDWSNEVSWTPGLPPTPPVMKSVIVLSVQSKPTVTNAWAEAGMDWSIPPDHSSDLFRLKIVRLPQVATMPVMQSKPKVAAPPIPGT